MTTLGSSPKKSHKSTFILILFLLLVAAGGIAFFLFFEGKAPAISILEPKTHIGTKGRIVFSAADDGSGIRSVTISISQGETSKVLFSDTHSRSGYTGVIGVSSLEKAIDFNPIEDGFKDGAATLTVVANDYSCRNFLKGNENRFTVLKSSSIRLPPG